MAPASDDPIFTAAMNVLVEHSTLLAKNIENGYFREADFTHLGKPIGRYRVEVKRIGRP